LLDWRDSPFFPFSPLYGYPPLLLAERRRVRIYFFFQTFTWSAGRLHSRAFLVVGPPPPFFFFLASGSRFFFSRQAADRFLSGTFLCSPPFRSRLLFVSFFTGNGPSFPPFLHHQDPAVSCRSFFLPPPPPAGFLFLSPPVRLFGGGSGPFIRKSISFASPPYWPCDTPSPPFCRFFPQAKSLSRVNFFFLIDEGQVFASFS